MASGLEECPTGILIDYIGNTTLSISPCDKGNGLEENLNVKDAAFAKSYHDEQSSHCQSSNAHNIPSSQYLGADLDRKKDEMCISSYEWRLPSPTTMSMITREACKIVDQLHTTLETSLWDEEFPLSSASEDECFEEFSNESEKLSQNLIVTKCFNATEENLCVNNESNIKSVTEDNSVTNEHCDATEKYSCVKYVSKNNSNINSLKESSRATEKKYVVVENVVIEESCGIKEICEKSKETGMDKVIEENIEKSSLVPEVSENPVAVADSIETEDPGTKSDHAVTIEKFVTEANSMLTEERCTIIEESCTIFDKGCTIVEESFNMIEENSTTKEKFKQMEEIYIVVEDNLSADVLNVGEDMHDPIVSPKESSYAHTDKEQIHVFSKETLKVKNDEPKETIPSSMKSKFKLVNIFKTPTFKTPIKYKKLEEKENVLQEYKDKNVLSARKITKTGQISSMKSVLGAKNMKGADILTSNLKILSSKNIIEKNPFVKEKSTNEPQDLAKETFVKSNTPLKRINSLKFQPALSKKTPVFKSYSVAETPNTAKVIRRSSSFQTRQVENPNQIKREKSFIGDSLKNVNSRRSLIQTPRIGNELQTPSKIGSFLPKSATPIAIPISSNTKSCTRILQVARPSFGSALRQTNAPVEDSPQVVGFKRPASTTNKARFATRLDMPSPLPKMMNDSIPRRLFPDYSTPSKRRI